MDQDTCYNINSLLFLDVVCVLAPWHRVRDIFRNWCKRSSISPSLRVLRLAQSARCVRLRWSGSLRAAATHNSLMMSPPLPTRTLLRGQGNALEPNLTACQRGTASILHHGVRIRSGRRNRVADIRRAVDRSHQDVTVVVDVTLDVALPCYGM